MGRERRGFLAGKFRDIALIALSLSAAYYLHTKSDDSYWSYRAHLSNLISARTALIGQYGRVIYMLDTQTSLQTSQGGAIPVEERIDIANMIDLQERQTALDQDQVEAIENKTMRDRDNAIAFGIFAGVYTVLPLAYSLYLGLSWKKRLQPRKKGV